MQYTKPYLRVEQQIALLESRGLQIPDRAKAAEYLTRIGYYRLSAYFVPFRERVVRDRGEPILLETFRPYTNFAVITDLYAFDKALRIQMLDVLERIEVGIRSLVSIQLGQHDPWAHRDGAFLHKWFCQARDGSCSPHQKWLTALNDRFVNSKDEFAVHFRAKYPNSELPIWMAVELLDFGPLSRLLAGLRTRDQMAIAGKFNIPRPDLLTTWIRSLSGVRNVCAHHGRLWNRALVDQPKIPRLEEVPALTHISSAPHGNRRVYAALAVARFLLRTINPRTKWQDRLKAHISSFPQSPCLSIRAAGFPENWNEFDLWQS